MPRIMQSELIWEMLLSQLLKFRERKEENLDKITIFEF